MSKDLIDICPGVITFSPIQQMETSAKFSRRTVIKLLRGCSNFIVQEQILYMFSENLWIHKVYLETSVHKTYLSATNDFLKRLARYASVE
jgi:hypothetical protein